jgi:hypothetical protein
MRPGHAERFYVVFLQAIDSFLDFPFLISISAVVRSPNAIPPKPASPFSRPFRMITTTRWVNTRPKTRRRNRLTPVRKLKNQHSNRYIFSAKK